MTKCPKCDLQWEPPCDQTACIELFGECISCRRFKLTEDEIKQIQTSAALERKAENARELGLDYYVPCCTDQTCPKCKSALEAKDEPVVWNGGVPAMLPKQKEGETFIVSYEPKQEAKDEPVAWISPTELLVMRGNALGGAKDWRVNVGLKPEDGDVGLYTTPPQRKPLTDEEIHQIFIANSVLVDNGNAYMVAGLRALNITRAIEAKLKQKNFKE